MTESPASGLVRLDNTEARQLALRLADTPMVEWRGIVGSLDQTTRHYVAKYLTNIAEHAARAASYVQWQDDHFEPAGRIADDRHSGAVKASNQAAAKVRKALGFTYPRQDVNF